MESDYPHLIKNNHNISFLDGKLIKLPKEYLKTGNKNTLEIFYKGREFSDENYMVYQDPIGFNCIVCKDIIIVGLILEKDRSSKVNTLKKKYPNNKFEKNFIISKIEEERKLINNEEYLPIKLVTQSVHELRNLNAKISSHVDNILNIQDDTHWESTFDSADENIRKIYVASRLIKFILDNVKFYQPDSIENCPINSERDFVVHRSVSKIVKIYKNNFNKKKSEISLSGYSYKKMRGDKEFFEIALMLLIENALKYSNDVSNIPPKVNIKELGNQIFVKISSFGKVIPEQDRDSLFTRGFRASVHSRSRTEGSGMGLHNASRILKRFDESTLEYSVDDNLNNGIGWNNFTITCNKAFLDS